MHIAHKFWKIYSLKDIIDDIFILTVLYFLQSISLDIHVDTDT